MWTAIAEALGAGRRRPEHLRGPGRPIRRTAARCSSSTTSSRSPDADAVVEPSCSPQRPARVLATSRRPLHLVGEHEHPVPPLALPPAEDRGPAERRGSGAVQLFVQRAQLVRPGFRLDDDERRRRRRRSAGGSTGCRWRSSSRPPASRLLSVRGAAGPARRPLGLGVTGADRPARQRTLGARSPGATTSSTRRPAAVFRRLGVLRGATSTSTRSRRSPAPGSDPLDAIGDLVDASLVPVRDGPDGEPRFHLLRTVSSFVRRWLTDAGELESARRRHAGHYAGLVETLAPRLRDRYVTARDRIEAELDNLRSALAWSLPDGPGPSADSTERTALGLRLCEALSEFWYASGYRYQAKAAGGCPARSARPPATRART